MKTLARITGIVTLFLLAFFFLGYLTMYLWNWIMPYLFRLPVIDFYMAIGMLLLSKILFGGIIVKTGPFGQKKFWRAKWESMSDEERMAFKQSFAQRCRRKWDKTGQPDI